MTLNNNTVGISCQCQKTSILNLIKEDRNEVHMVKAEKPAATLGKSDQKTQQLIMLTEIF